MKIFISWSGERSKSVANALHDWLPNVIQSLQPWMSESDIKKGARWGPDIASQLEEARVGLICLTPENLEEPWILFEAGALSKTLEETYVCPYLFDVEPTNIKGPIAQFQMTKADKEDTRRLIHTINRALPKDNIPEEKLNAAFDKWWPDLEASLKKVPEIKEEPESQRPDREILEEILELAREQTRLIRTPPSPFAGKVPSSPLHITLDTGERATILGGERLIGPRPPQKGEEET